MPTPNDAPAPPPGEEVQLLPCPFCGAEAGLKFTEAGVRDYGYQRVYCYRNELDCGAKVQRRTTAEAVAAWNRRGLNVARDVPDVGMIPASSYEEAVRAVGQLELNVRTWRERAERAEAARDAPMSLSG